MVLLFVVVVTYMNAVVVVVSYIGCCSCFDCFVVVNLIVNLVVVVFCCCYCHCGRGGCCVCGCGCGCGCCYDCSSGCGRVWDCSNTPLCYKDVECMVTSYAVQNSKLLCICYDLHMPDKSDL